MSILIYIYMYIDTHKLLIYLYCLLIANSTSRILSKSTLIITKFNGISKLSIMITLK